MRATTDFIRDRVAADTATAGPLGVGDLLLFRAADGEVLATAFDGEHDFPIELDEGVEAACRLVMDQVQDVMGRLHRPWPELRHPDGSFVGVLEPADAAGIACWALRGVPFCAIGQLAAAIPAVGLRLAAGSGGDAAGRDRAPGDRPGGQGAAR